MNKSQVEVHVKDSLEGDDSLIGFFQAMQLPKIWLYFLIGPLAFLSMKTYFVAVSKRGLYFHRLNLLGKFKDYDFFEFNEIDSVKIGGGILQRPMTFQFKNKRKIKIKAQLKGVEKVAKLTPEVQQYIENNIAVAR